MCKSRGCLIWRPQFSHFSWQSPEFQRPIGIPTPPGEGSGKVPDAPPLPAKPAVAQPAPVPAPAPVEPKLPLETKRRRGDGGLKP
jgi:hypothetical protein